MINYKPFQQIAQTLLSACKAEELKGTEALLSAFSKEQIAAMVTMINAAYDQKKVDKETLDFVKECTSSHEVWTCCTLLDRYTCMHVISALSKVNV